MHYLSIVYLYYAKISLQHWTLFNNSPINQIFVKTRRYLGRYNVIDKFTCLLQIRQFFG